jgi:group II intron reverse transcriptase/maturase
MYSSLRRRGGSNQLADARDRLVPAGSHVGTSRDYLCRHERESAIAARGTRAERTAFAAQLLKRVADPRNLKLALDHLASDGGDAAGPNGLRPADLSPASRRELARTLGKAISSGTYRPGPDRDIRIPKGPGRGDRVITIQNVEDRAVQRAVVQILQPIIDPRFQDSSYGYRPHLGREDALIRADALASASGLWVWVVADVQDAFDQVPHGRLMDALRKHVPAEDILALVETVIDNGRKRGIQQGGALSPLLLNVYLDHVLDRPWRKAHPETPLVRVADDLLVLTGNRQQAESALTALTDRLRPAGMALKREKVDIADLTTGQRVEWLGYAISQGATGVEAHLTERNWEQLESALAATHDKPDAPIRALETIAGWIDQAGPCYCDQDVTAVHTRIERIARTYAYEEVPTRDEVQTRWGSAYDRWNGRRRADKARERDD